MDLIEARRKAGFNRETAAVRLGVCLATLGRWEKGMSSISSNILPILQEVYGLTDAEVLSIIREQDARKQLQQKESA